MPQRTLPVYVTNRCIPSSSTSDQATNYTVTSGYKQGRRTPRTVSHTNHATFQALTNCRRKAISMKQTDTTKVTHHAKIPTYGGQPCSTLSVLDNSLSNHAVVGRPTEKGSVFGHSRPSRLTKGGSISIL